MLKHTKQFVVRLNIVCLSITFNLSGIFTEFDFTLTFHLEFYDAFENYLTCFPVGNAKGFGQSNLEFWNAKNVLFAQKMCSELWTSWLRTKLDCPQYQNLFLKLSLPKLHLLFWKIGLHHKSENKQKLQKSLVFITFFSINKIY